MRKIHKRKAEEEETPDQSSSKKKKPNTDTDRMETKSPQMQLASDSPLPMMPLFHISSTLQMLKSELQKHQAALEEEISRNEAARQSMNTDIEASIKSIGPEIDARIIQLQTIGRNRVEFDQSEISQTDTLRQYYQDPLKNKEFIIEACYFLRRYSRQANQTTQVRRFHIGLAFEILSRKGIEIDFLAQCRVYALIKGEDAKLPDNLICNCLKMIDRLATILITLRDEFKFDQEAIGGLITASKGRLCGLEVLLDKRAESKSCPLIDLKERVGMTPADIVTLTKCAGIAMR